VADFLTELLQFLQNAYNTPSIFLPLVVLYAIAIAVVLPIPIELTLLLPIINQQWAYLGGIALALAVGKMVGAWLVFLLGVNVEKYIRRWSARWRVADWFVKKADLFVQRTGYLGLYVLLSIPLMSDTIPIYLYSLFNVEGKALQRNMFLVANFLAALNRVAILVVLYFVGLNLFSMLT